MRRLLLLAIFGILCAATCRANDIYIAQNGSGDGSSCASAKIPVFFNNSANWGSSSTQIGSDSRVHLCGVFIGTAGSTMLTFQGSGTSGHPIILLFEAGARLTAPYWSFTNGAIQTNSHTDLTIDGGSNGIIENTANGTLLANQQASAGVTGSNCTDCIIRNLVINNIYVHTSLTDSASGAYDTYGVKMSGGSNLLIDSNTIHDVKWAIVYGYPGSQTVSNITISKNTGYNIDHAVTVGDNNGSAILNTVVISGNTFHDMVNWDDTLDHFHHDYIHVFAQNGNCIVNGLQIYNNYFYGDPGAHPTAFITLEQAFSGGNRINSPQVFNNVVTNSSSAHTPPYGYFDIWSLNTSLINNTIVGSTTSQDTANACFLLGGTTTVSTLENNTCRDVAFFIKAQSGASWTTIDYNDWYNSSANFFAGVTYYNFANWKTFCSCDSHSITTNPNLDSNFKPQAGSPIINAGANLTGLSIAMLNRDKLAQARPSSGNWDMGALNSGTVSAAVAPPTGLMATVN